MFLFNNLVVIARWVCWPLAYQENKVIIISLKIDLCYLLYVQRSTANCLRDLILLYFSVFTNWINKDCCNVKRFQFSPKPMAVTTRVNKDRIHKVVTTNLFMFVLIDVTNLTSLSDKIDATPNSVFLPFELRLIILFWYICDLFNWVSLICVWLTKFLQYCWMLFNSKKSLKCKMLTLKCF